MGFDVGQGPPLEMIIVNTDPEQLRSRTKADQAYTLRLNYIPNPPEITASDQTLYLPEKFHEGLYLKFVEKVALDLGDENLSLIYRQLYEAWLTKNKPIASNRQNVVSKVPFRWV